MTKCIWRTHTSANTLSTIERLIHTYFLPILVIKKHLVAYDKHIVYELDPKKILTTKIKKQVIVRQAVLDDLKNLVEKRAREGKFGVNRVDKKRYMISVLKRLKAGHRCFIAERTNDIHGYLWIAFKEFYASEIEKRVTLRKDEAMIYDLYVFSCHRRKGVTSKLIEQSIKNLEKSRYQKIYSLTAHYNEPSRRAFERVNGKAGETIVFLKFLGMIRFLRVYPKAHVNAFTARAL